jgi:serine/threonine protein kinase
MRGTKKLYAMKKLKKSKMIERNQVAHVQNERDALAYLNDFYKQNLWVVRLYYSFQDAIYLYLVMEYAPGGDLMTTLMKYEVFTEEEARFYAAEIVLAVESIHKFDYIHRDIKPDNILLDRNGHIKLSDFGLCTGLTTDDRVSKFQNKYQQYLQQESESSSEHKPLSGSGNSNNTNTVDKKDKEWYNSINSDRFNSWKQKRRVLAYSEVGTPDYMAPEVLNPDGTGYGKEADWWSVGVILFEMMAGFPVFFSDSSGGSDSTIRKIINWKQTLDEVFNDVDLSPEAQDLIRRLLTDRKERLGTNGADEIKRHPFFKDIDWDDIRAHQAPIVPRIEHPLDTSNFPVDDPDRFSDSEDESENTDTKEEVESRREIDSKYPIFRGRRLRQTDIPFIGFTYKNLAAVPSLINRPPTPPHMRK